jgi:hypothetical protein
MSRQADERRYKRKTLPGVQKPAKEDSGFVFRPTKEVRELIKQNWQSADRNLSVIESYVQSGVRFSTGYASNTGAVWGTLRGPGDDWRTSPSVTAWHASLERVVAQLAFYLSEVNPQFPEGVSKTSFDELNNW